MRKENYDINSNLKNYVLQIENGGTGVTTEEEALEILNAVASSKINKPNGILGLNSKGFIDLEQFPSNFGGAAAVNIFGPREVVLGRSILLEITNFDIFTNYQIEVYKLQLEQENEKLLVTGLDFGDDAWFSINGSVYPIRVTVDNASLEGNLITSLEFPNTPELLSIAATNEGSLVAISQPSKVFNGSQAAGEVILYSYTEDSGYVEILKTNPEVLVTRIVYSGKGTKTFKANNSVITKTDEGYVDLYNAGNIIIEAEGATLIAPSVPQQGLPQYPNGLVPYVPTKYEFLSSDSGAIFGTALTVSFTGESNITRNIDGTYTVESTVFGDDVEFISNFYRVNTTDFGGVGSITYGAVVRVKHALLFELEGLMEFTCERKISLKYISEEQKGLPQYPNGLPVYEPFKPSYSYKDEIKITSSNFNLSGTSINQTVFPWENFNLGTTLDVSDQVLVLGCPRNDQSLYPNGGEVIVRRKINDIWGIFRLSIAKSNPYPYFGSSIKLWDNGQRLMVGAPGLNKIVQYNFTSNTYSEGVSYTLPNLTPEAKFGVSIDISVNNNLMAVGAPGNLSKDCIFIYQQNNSIFELIDQINITLPQGQKLGGNVRILNGNRVFSSVQTNSGLNNYVVEITKNSENTWEISKTFNNPSSSENDQFGKNFDISTDGDMMFITASGNISTKGITYIWVKAGGVWYYYKPLLHPVGYFNDGFSRSIAVNANGKAGHFLSSDMEKGSLNYFK